MPWTQWINDIWWWGHCLWCKKVKPVDAVDAVTQWTMSPPTYTTIPWHPLHTASSGLTFLYKRQCPHHHIPLFYCVHWFELFVSKTMSPPPYNTIPLRTAYCIHCVLWFDLFCTKDNVPTTIYH